MPNPFKRFLEVAAGGYAKSFPFNGGSAGGGGLAGATAYDLNFLNRDRVFWSPTPGSGRNWQAVVGERHLCSVVGICLNWYIGTIQTAPIQMNQGKGKNKKPIDQHPMAELIRRPNPYYSGSLLWAGTVLDYRTRGNAYWFKVRDKLGRVVQLWWIPSILVRPRWSGNKGAEFIDGYVYTVGRDQTPIAMEDVIHFKHGLDYGSMGRLGLDPLAPVLRSIGAVNSAENFTANLLLNNATPGMLIVPDPALFRENAIVDQNVFTTSMDSVVLKQKIKSLTSGDNVGDPLVLDIPWVLQKMGFSPEELALDKLQSVPIDVVCAAMELDPMVVGLPSDRETYSNKKESLQSAWENSVMPMHASWGETLDLRLLPDFETRSDISTEWDYSGVPALQEDQDNRHSRVRSDFQANMIDLWTAKRETDRDPEERDKGIYFWMLPKISDNAAITGALLPDAMREEFQQAEADQAAQQDAQEQQRVAAMASPTRQIGAAKNSSLKSDDGDWITLPNGAHINLDDPPAGFTGGHVVSAKEVPDKATRSAIAKASAYTVGAEIQRYAEETNEPILAKAVGGTSLRDNEPVDVMVVKGGIVAHGVEMKTMVSNKSGQISMKKEAVARKAAWMAEHNAPFHTVVFDDQNVFNADGPGKHDESKRTIYYRRGFGAFSVSAMHQVPDLATLSELMNTEDEKLPKAAQPPKSYMPPTPKEAKRWAFTSS